MANTINIEELSNALTEEIQKYKNEIEVATEKIIKDISKDIVKRVKENSPVRTPVRKDNYRSGWAMRKEGNRYLIYNKNHPQIVHLLEFGHLSRNGKRVEGKLNLIKQYNKAMEDLPKRIKESVKRIGK